LSHGNLDEWWRSAPLPAITLIGNLDEWWWSVPPPATTLMHDDVGIIGQNAGQNAIFRGAFMAKVKAFKA
jgi:hypothetical protein